MRSGERARTRRMARGGLFARLRRSPFGWLVAFALFFQLGLAANHGQAAPSSLELAAAALSAAVGQEVSLCAEHGGDHSGAPDHSCCDDCAFCGAACHSTAIPPQDVAEILAPERVSRKGVAAPITPPLLAANFFFAARPRAPPIPV
jgi:hypothetical protein